MFVTDLCLDFFNDLGIKFLIFPSTLHQLLNLADNNFHGIFKQKYYQYIFNECNDNISHLRRIELAYNFYCEISNEVVKNLFVHCGLINNNFSEKIIEKLVTENSYFPQNEFFFKISNNGW